MKNAVRTALSLALAAHLTSACVSPIRHKETQDRADYFERQYKDLAAFHGKLEAENARLRGELELYQGKGPIDASATQALDERLERLKQITEAIGTSSGAAPGDVEFVAVEGGYGVRVTDAVLFDSGSDEIKPEGRTILLKVAQQITSQPYQRVWVRGHTDSDPVKRAATVEKFPHGNIELSAARAVEVAALLTASGVDDQRVVVAGFGPAEPVVPNKDAESKRRNRRVEIYVLERDAAGH